MRYLFLMRFKIAQLLNKKMANKVGNVIYFLKILQEQMDIYIPCLI